MMVIFPLCFIAYDYCNNNFQKYLFVNSGLFSILWLWITGMIIKTVYYFIIKKVNCLKVLNLDIKITFTILAIVLGKYVWLDSFEIFSLTSIKDKISILSKKYRVDIYLLIYFSIITLYLIYRWYSIKDISIINTNYPLITLILIALVVKKILYFFIYNSMISYVDYLKESNKN